MMDKSVYRHSNLVNSRGCSSKVEHRGRELCTQVVECSSFLSRLLSSHPSSNCCNKRFKSESRELECVYSESEQLSLELLKEVPCRDFARKVVVDRPCMG